MTGLLRQIAVAGIAIAYCHASVAVGTTAAAVILIEPALLTGYGLKRVPPFPGTCRLRVVRSSHEERESEIVSGKLNVAVFSVEGGASYSPSFPGDELVSVLSGSARLTDGRGGPTHTFAVGQWFFVPRGWIGEWETLGHYRELAIVTATWKQGLFGKCPPNRSKHEPVALVRQILTSQVPGNPPPKTSSPNVITSTVLQRGDLEVTLLRAARAVNMPTEQLQSDELVAVLAGKARLVPAIGAPIELLRGRTYIVTTAFRGHLRAAPGYRALVAKVTEAAP